jgi:hypothetical protein
LLYLAAGLIFLVGFAHSYLGERYILIRLFRRDNLPKLFGGTQFTKNTLRFAWHLTTLAWFGLALILLHLAAGQITKQVIGNIVGTTFFIHFLVALIASKGKHLSWPVFLVISLACLYAFNT